MKLIIVLMIAILCCLSSEGNAGFGKELKFVLPIKKNAGGCPLTPRWECGVGRKPVFRKVHSCVVQVGCSPVRPICPAVPNQQCKPGEFPVTKKIGDCTVQTCEAVACPAVMPVCQPGYKAKLIGANAAGCPAYKCEAVACPTVLLYCLPGYKAKVIGVNAAGCSAYKCEPEFVCPPVVRWCKDGRQAISDLEHGCGVCPEDSTKVCPMLNFQCAPPPPGCSYGEAPKDQNGCQKGCGELVCVPGSDQPPLVSPVSNSAL